MPLTDYLNSDAPTPAPSLSSGYGHPAGGVLSELSKLMLADSKQNLHKQIAGNESLADEFEKLSQNPSYAEDIRTDAHRRSVAIRQLLAQNPAKKLPVDYQPDKNTGYSPAMTDLLYRHHINQMKARGGEPAPPAEPQQPAEIPPPPGMPSLNALPSIAGAPMAGAQNPLTATPPPPPQAGGQPGGQHLGPNAISPAPAIGGMSTASAPPPPPAAAPSAAAPSVSAPPLPASQSDQSDLEPTMMGPAEIAARASAGEMRHLSKPEAVTLGYPPDLVPEDGIVVNKNFIPATSKAATSQMSATLRAGQHGLVLSRDPSTGRWGVQGVPEDQLPPEIKVKRDALEAQGDYRDALMKWRTARTLQEKQIAYAKLNVEKQKVAATFGMMPPGMSGADTGGVAVPHPQTLGSPQGPQTSLNDAALEGLPDGQKSQVKALVDYRLNPNTIPRMQRQAFLQRAYALDPSYDETQYNARNRLRQDYTSGKGKGAIESINKLVGHLAALKQKGNALQNQPLRFWNSISNGLANATGDPRVKEFLTAATAVEGELASVFKNNGGSGTDQETKEWRKSIDSSDSPDQINGVVQTALELMNSRLSAISDRWETGMGRPRDFQIIGDRARRILHDDLGVTDPDALDPVHGKGERSPEQMAPPPPTEGNSVPDINDRVADQTTATINGKKMIWRGRGWAPAPSK